MSIDNFDFEKALNNIKANLFDIYENQEKIIGTKENDTERQKLVNQYIKMKDNATLLINNIEGLYNTKKINSSIKDKIEEFKEEPKSVETKDIYENIEENQKENIIEVPKIIEDEKNEVPDELPQENNIEVKEEIDDTKNEKVELSEEQQKFYLDNRNGKKPNFAYVPPDLIKIIKENGNIQLKNFENINEEEIEDSQQFYKKDKDAPKGIIVRNDQYMKLALSKHRQETVLIDAKKYRIDQVKLARKKFIEQEEKNMDTKIKSLKAS